MRGTGLTPVRMGDLTAAKKRPGRFTPTVAGRRRGSTPCNGRCDVRDWAQVTIPVVASGGVGTLEHLVDGATIGGADALLAASIFHLREHSVAEAKRYLASHGVQVRPAET